MGFLSRFEGRMEDTFEGAADKMFDAPISPVQIAKKAEKQMRREKMVGAGKQYAPTLYTVLVNPDDDRRLMGYYPTLAGETETYLTAKASEQGLVMDGQPLVRFIVDEDLKHGKFDIIAEAVAAPIIAQLRAEEMHRYGLAAAPAPGGYGAPAQPYPAQRPQAPAPQQYGGYNQDYAAPAPAPAPYGGYDQYDRSDGAGLPSHPVAKPMLATTAHRATAAATTPVASSALRGRRDEGADAAVADAPPTEAPSSPRGAEGAMRLSGASARSRGSSVSTPEPPVFSFESSLIPP